MPPLPKIQETLMKRTLLFLVIALSSMKMMAEGLTATLQQGETMTAFYGVNAFVDAYNAAEDGAVITLSEGQFNYVSSIEKSITLVGNMAFDVEGYEKTYISGTTVNADNVTFEGIYFTSNVALGNINNCHIKRCRIGNELTYVSSTIHTNTLIDQCVINIESAMSTSRNYCLKNSTIHYFNNNSSSEHIAYITNCYICYYCLLTYRSSNWGGNYNYYSNPYAVYKNNILGIDCQNNGSWTMNLYSPSEFYNNYFYRTTTIEGFESYIISYTFNSGCINQGNQNSGDKSVYISSSDNFNGKYKIDSFGMLGDDGTPVGITGGSGFSPYPSIPRITSKEIDSKTDSNGKLNVKITVSTEETLVKEEKPEDNPVEEPTE